MSEEVIIECPYCGAIYFIPVEDVEHFRCECEDDFFSDDDPMERNMDEQMLINIGMGD